MSEIADTYRALREWKRQESAAFGIPCPECVAKLPRANPAILIPGRTCRIHGYTDPRPEPTIEEYRAAGMGVVEMEGRK